jgi:peptidoglycan/xylan/chitin deacetylase (PgdA/CDA1 family)
VEEEMSSILPFIHSSTLLFTAVTTLLTRYEDPIVIIDVLLDVPADLRQRALYSIDILMNAAGTSWRAFGDPDGKPVTVLLRYGGNVERRGVKASVVLDIPFESGFYRIDRDPHLFEGISKVIVRDSGGLVSIERDGDAVICHFKADLLANLFFHLSRIEESLPTGWDVDGRFGAEHSLLRQVDLLHVPVVDNMIEVFVDTLIEACRIAEIPLLRKARWPNGERMAVFFSHDVDRLRKWTPGRVIRELRGGLRGMVDVGKVVVSGDDPYRRGLRSVIEMEERAGIRSTFYVGGRSRRRRVEERRDLSYRLRRERNLRVFLTQVASRGWEVGLHGSFSSFLSAEHLVVERREVERCVRMTVDGVRQHYLRFAVSETWRCQEAAGFLYDATLGYPEAEGFRAGTSLPFVPYDTQNERPFTLIEIPLLVMDVTLDGYRRYDARTAEERVFSLFSTVERHRGVFSFLLHQSALDREEHPFIGELYRRLLGHIPSEHVCVATGREIARWWKQRTGMTIHRAHQEGSGWRWVWQSAVGIDCLTLEVDGVRTFQSIDIHGCDGEVHRGGDGSVSLRLFHVPAEKPIEVVMVL